MIGEEEGMSRKTLVVLVAVLAALSAAIVLRGWRAPVPAGAAAAGGATSFFVSIFPSRVTRAFWKIWNCCVSPFHAKPSPVSTAFSVTTRMCCFDAARLRFWS